MPKAQIPEITVAFKDRLSPEDVRLAAQKRLKAKQPLLDLQAEEAARKARVQQ